jgi:hypothetical protein
MNQPKPLDPEVVPNTSAAAISVPQANAQPVFRPSRMLASAAGTKILAA